TRQQVPMQALASTGSRLRLETGAFYLSPPGDATRDANASCGKSASAPRLNRLRATMDSCRRRCSAFRFAGPPRFRRVRLLLRCINQVAPQARRGCKKHLRVRLARIEHLRPKPRFKPASEVERV